MSRHHEQAKVHPCPPAQPWREGPLVPAGAAIRTHAVRGVPWGCPTHGALPATTECSRAQGRGQAPIRRGVRGKAGGGDASPSWEETAHACVAEASRSPSPSVSDADVWVSAAQRGCPARLSEGDPPRAARAPPPGIPLASVDSWPCTTRFRALPMGAVVCAILDGYAVGSALLRPRPRAAGSCGRAGHEAHSTVVHG